MIDPWNLRRKTLMPVVLKAEEISPLTLEGTVWVIRTYNYFITFLVCVFLHLSVYAHAEACVTP